MWTKCAVAIPVLAMGLFLAGMKVPSAGSQTPAPTAVPAYPDGTDSALGQRIATILADPAVARAHWGIAVTTLEGVPLYGHDEAQFFRPASNAKLFTTAAAMQLLGPQSTVPTEVIADSVTPQGLVNGDLRLRSDGDANLSGVIFPYAPATGESAAPADPLRAIDDLAAQVAAHGVRHVTGNIVADDTQWTWEPYPQSWAIDDMLWDYGAPVSSLSVNDSTIALTVHSGARAGDPATVTQSPDVGFYSIRVQAVTTALKSQTHIHIDRAIGSRTVLVTGEIALDGKDVEQLAVSDPPLFAAQALRASLVAQGIAVDGEAHATERASTLADSFTKQAHEAEPGLPGPSDLPHSVSEVCNDSCGVTLAQRTSPPLAQDLLYTLKESQNLHAEQLLRRLGRVYGREASSAQGARVVRQFLVNAGLDGNDFVFYDGSGLSDHDLVTPRATAQLLTYASRQTWSSAWKASLPIGGVDGTLASRFKDSPLKGHVFAKTGTLGESRGLAGYVDCASGKQVIFAVYVDNHAPGGAADRTAMDRIVEAIAASY